MKQNWWELKCSGKNKRKKSIIKEFITTTLSLRAYANTLIYNVPKEISIPKCLIKKWKRYLKMPLKTWRRKSRREESLELKEFKWSKSDNKLPFHQFTMMMIFKELLTFRYNKWNKREQRPKERRSNKIRSAKPRKPTLTHSWLVSLKETWPLVNLPKEQRILDSKWKLIKKEPNLLKSKPKLKKEDKSCWMKRSTKPNLLKSSPRDQMKPK